MVDYIKLRFSHLRKSCLQRHYCNYSMAEPLTSVCLRWNLVASGKQQRSRLWLPPGLSGIWERSLISPARCNSDVPPVFTFFYFTHQRRLRPSQEMNQTMNVSSENCLSFTWSYSLFLSCRLQSSCHLSVAEETSIPRISSHIHTWPSLHTWRTNKSMCATLTDLRGSRKKH